MGRRFWGAIFIVMNLWIYPQMALSDHAVRLLKINTKWEEKSKTAYKYNYIVKYGRHHD